MEKLSIADIRKITKHAEFFTHKGLGLACQLYRRVEAAERRATLEAASRQL